MLWGPGLRLGDELERARRGLGLGELEGRPRRVGRDRSVPPSASAAPFACLTPTSPAGPLSSPCLAPARRRRPRRRGRGRRCTSSAGIRAGGLVRAGSVWPARVGWRIWRWTMPSNVVSGRSRTSASCWKASSRLGPVTPVVPARLSTLSGPHRGDLLPGEIRARDPHRRVRRAGLLRRERPGPRRRARDHARASSSTAPHTGRTCCALRRVRPPGRDDGRRARRLAKTARRAALLHDIGKAVSHEIEGPHALVGGDLARRHGESEAVAHAMEAHHNEVEPQTVEAVHRPGRRRALRRAPRRARGVARAVRQAAARPRAHRHAPRRRRQGLRDAGRPRDPRHGPAGRARRRRAVLLSHEIAREIEQELEYPGQIKVTVIRESRATDYAAAAPTLRR